MLVLDVDRLWYVMVGWSDLKALRHLVPQSVLLQRGPYQFPRAIHTYVCFFGFCHYFGWLYFSCSLSPPPNTNLPTFP